ncbi:hypothetical protein JCM14469_42210 [Desulfatiferula olefinivorans]
MGRILKKKPDSRKSRLKNKPTQNGSIEPGAEGASVNVDVPKTEAVKRPAPQPKSAGPKKTVTPKEPGFIEKSQSFLREVKAELKKVVWPAKNQTVASTVVVIVLVIIVSSFLGLFDLGLKGLIRMVLH